MAGGPPAPGQNPPPGALPVGLPPGDVGGADGDWVAAG
jgi:hypothetical protein